MTALLEPTERERGYDLAISTIRSWIGHGLSASTDGRLEAVAHDLEANKPDALRSSAPQEPDDDARLARWFAGQLSDQAHQCRKVKWVAQANLYGDASDFLERIADRLQAKAPETGEG